MNLKRDTELVSVHDNYGREIPVINRYHWRDGAIWCWSDNPYGGVMYITVARNIEEAIEAIYDELPPIDKSELYEAYGFDSQEEYEIANKAYAANVRDGEGKAFDWPELAEGYAYQPNATGTGIVSIDYCEAIWALSADECKREGLKIRIQRSE